MYKVSICIPAYEQPKNLYQCLKSIEMQTYKDFEVIITDDSASDKLISIIDGFRDKIHIQYYRNLPAKGSPKNWNESIKYARGKYIKILHHDDFFYKEDSLEKLVDLLDSNPSNKVLFCSSRHVDSSFEYHSSHILSDDNMSKIRNNPQKLFFGNLIGAPSIMMYHRDLNIYFDVRMKWLVDLDFYIRILEKNSFVYTTEELICINIGEENRVTYQCQNNRHINLYEHLLLLKKLSLKTLSLDFRFYLIKLFLKFDVRTFDDVKKLGYKDHINDFKVIFFIVNFLNPIYQVYKKVKNEV